MLQKRFLYILLGFGFLGSFILPATQVQAETRSILFPVIGSTNYGNDFGAPRSGGRTHKGNDIFGRKMQPLIAVTDGIVRFVAYPEPNYGYFVSIEDADGYHYWYIHINNDTPGTDDGRGGGILAYAPDIHDGNPVVAGQLIGWMGDSGNAERTPPHLHFEIHRPDGNAINSYPTLQISKKISKPATPPALPNEILPFGQSAVGSSIAYGDVDEGNPGKELIVGAGAGGGPQVMIYNLDGRLLSQFFAYAKTFRGGIDVAAGDVNGDGKDEVITASGAGTPTEIRIFTGKGSPLGNFFPYAPTFQRGANVTSADMNGDGVDEIITGARAGGGPHVRVFSQDGTVRTQFFAYSPNFRMGVDVAAYPATETTSSMIVTGAGAGGGPHVRVWNQYAERIAQFFAYDEGFRGGVRVAVANVDETTPEPEILTAPAAKGGPNIRAYTINGQLSNLFNVFEPWWRGGYDVAGTDGVLAVSSSHGGRRTSIRPIRITEEVPPEEPPQEQITEDDFVP